MDQPLHCLSFDFDGVLADSVDIKTQAFCSMYEEDGFAVQQRVREHHEFHGGMDRFTKFPIYERFADRDTPSAARLEELCAEFSRRVVDGVIAAPEIPGASKTLAEFAERLPLYIVSGVPEQELRDIVDARGWDQYFAGVFGAPRSKAENLRLVAADAQISPMAILMVGDAITDYEGASAVGSAFVGLSDRPEVAFPGVDLDFVSTHDELRRFARRRLDG